MFRSYDSPVAGARIDWIVGVLLFAGLSAVYFATLSGITSSNDGSHYALLRTMVDNRVFTLEQFDDYAEGNDIAQTPDGRLYSDRPPGTALAAIPFYLLGEPLPDALRPLPSRHDAGNARLPYTLLLPVFAGAGTAVILYVLARRLGLMPAAALLAVLFFALGTAHWKYSTVLYSHALSGFLIALSLFLVLSLADRELTSWAWYLLLGFTLGLAVVVEYSNALVALIIGGFWLVRTWPLALERPAQTWLPWLAGGLLPTAFLAFYDWTNFGGPLTLSYAYAVNYPWAGDFASTFSFPLLPGLKALLYQGEGGGWCGGPPCFNQGLIILSPVLLLALPGLLPFYRRDRSWFFVTAALFLVYLLLFARHHTSHGFTGDGRYLVPFVGLLVLPLACALDWLLSPERRPLIRITGLISALLLFAYSLRSQFIHIGTSYNYTLDTAALAGDPAALVEQAGRVFTNAPNLPLLAIPLVALIAGPVLVILLRNRR